MIDNTKIAKDITVYIITFLLISVCTAFAADYREKDKKCMEECHSKDIRYTPYGFYGNQRSIHIDYDKFLNSKHGIFYCIDCHYDVEAGEKTHFVKEPSIKCESCHVETDRYSERIAALFKAKDIKMEDKKRVFKDFKDSLHGKAYYEKKKNAPYCTGCHDGHNANLSDKDSTISRCNLPKTCSRCHPYEATGGDGVFSKIAQIRVNGHKKGDSSIDYSRKNCVACHQSDAAHGKKMPEHNCMSCHKKEAGFLFTDFHGKNLSVLTYLLNFGLVFGGIIFIGVGIGYMAGRQKETKEEHESH